MIIKLAKLARLAFLLLNPDRQENTIQILEAIGEDDLIFTVDDAVDITKLMLRVLVTLQEPSVYHSRESLTVDLLQRYFEEEEDSR